MAPLGSDLVQVEIIWLETNLKVPALAIVPLVWAVSVSSALASNLPEEHKTTSSESKGKTAGHKQQDYSTTYSASGAGYMDAAAGGSGGGPFDDKPYIPTRAIAVCVDLRTGMWIDSIRTIWAKKNSLTDRNSWISSPIHGSSGGKETPVWLPKGENIIAVYGYAAGLVSEITIATEKNRYGPYGSHGSDGRPLMFRAPKGWCIVGFRGRAGLGLDSVGPIYQRVP